MLKLKYLFKIIISLFAAIVISCSISSCKSENIVSPVQQDTSTNFKYPFTNNSNWFHTTRNFVFNIRPDSIKHYFNTDTLIENGFSVLKNDTVINGVTYKIYKTDHSSTAHAYTSIEYFRQIDSGLLCSSTNVEGTGFGPFSLNGSHILYNGKSFEDIRTLINFASGDNSENQIAPDLKCLQFPIVPGLMWFFRKIDAITDQYKKYLSYETVNSLTGNFNCIKIQRQNLLGGIPDTNIVLFDFYSKVGILKRDYHLKNIQYTNSMGQVLGYFDVKDEVVLNSYFIQ